MGFIKEHRGARYTLLKRDLGEQEMRRLAGEYTSKGESDREKTGTDDSLTRKPRMPVETDARTFRRAYGADGKDGPDSIEECGHCDNCSLTTAEQSQRARKHGQARFHRSAFHP